MNYIKIILYIIQIRKIIFFVILFFFNNGVNAELLKPSPLLKPNQVISIQLSALNNNDAPYKNFGIQQTWEFAHPKNRKFTGPLKNFTKMIYSTSYFKMLNHKKHIINEIAISNNIALFFVEIIDSNNTKYNFTWIVEKVLTEGDFSNCWMTTSVSKLIKHSEDA